MPDVEDIREITYSNTVQGVDGNQSLPITS